MIGAKEYAEVLFDAWSKDRAMIMLFNDIDSAFIMPHGYANMTVNKKRIDIRKLITVKMLEGLLEKADSGIVFRKSGDKLRVEFINDDYVTGKVVSSKEAMNMMDTPLWKLISKMAIGELK